jgi:flagellar export protein FliJ
MKRFQFSLQTVHNLREMRCDEAERHLAQATAVVMAAATVIEEIRGHRDAAETKLAGATGLVNAAELAWQSNYLVLLAQREVEARTRLKTLEHERESRRETVLATTREVKVTGQLRSRQHARHTADAERAEQSMLDEMAIAITLRRGATQ